MDIHLAIEHLGLNKNRYGLDDANPPHKIIKWLGPDSQPTDSQLSDAWAEIQAAKPMNDWKQKMVISDGSLMPRHLEDLITDKFAGDAGTSLQERYDAKIKIRGEQP